MGSFRRGWTAGIVGSRFATTARLAPRVAWIVTVAAVAASPAQAQRARVSINDGWKFHRGDPAGVGADLRYEVLPELKLRPDGADFDAGVMDDSDTAVRKGVLRPYILPSGNAFIRDPAKRHARPTGNPGGDVSYVKDGFDDAGWQSVTLPHDWAIAGPFIAEGPYGGMGRLPSWGAGWYRRKLVVPATDRGRSVFLDVDGAMSYATVWLNGKLVGGWPYGYNSWRLDLTPYVVPGGDNQLAIRLDNPMESSRWYPGGGIYRNVWLTTADPVHVAQWGTKVTTSDVSARQAQVALALTVENLASAGASVVAETAIFAIDAADRRLGGAVARIAPATVVIGAGGTASISGTTTIRNPRLWGPPPTQVPNRYVAVTTLRRGGRVIDTYETRFGVRALTFDPNRGVIVNGEHVMLNGVNQHHDLGALGAAWNDRAAKRQLDILADMGVNAIRMAHNPPAPELLDMTDRMGFLVMDEVFDVWERRKTPFDTHLIFKDWHEPDLRAMMRRDFNHPSVIMWSIGNEVGEQYGGRGAAVAREVMTIAHQEDATRPVMGSMNVAAPGSDFASTFDAIALNYQGAGVRTKLPTFAGFRAKHPDKVIFSSESAAAYSSRGDYQFPVPGGISNPVRPGVGGDETTHQVSAYELFAADFGGTADRTWAAQDQNPTVAGEFVWTGFDYLGEPAPYYSSRSSYFGIVDLAGFPKDRFWLYKARWRPDVKFVHVLPHWNFAGREGQVTPVHAFTSADEAELFVNGKSQGRQKRAPFAYRFRWDYVRYEPGDIKVVTWKDGKPWAEETVRTTGAPVRIAAAADRTSIADDGKDLAWVSVVLNDARGGFVPRDQRMVRFTIEGPGEIVATDNGDPTDFVAFPSAARKLFNGRAIAIVRAVPGKRGAIRVRVAADGLPDATVQIASQKK
ncbi:beta-galactosidase GalB [Sphingomonas arantia]|uniref:Beta-galactosidase GalB n=1 Tax=Sphingomonas arantia TaxID=1460676 RepID=A0ABW4TUE2_9SPHN